MSLISKAFLSAPNGDQVCVASASGSMALYVATVPVPFSVKSTVIGPMIVGGSLTSSRVTVTSRLPNSVPPSEALTVTSYFDCSSKFGDVLNLRSPSLSSTNLTASVPESVDQMSPALSSGSVAV